jgi:predicted dehydrogenase
MSPWNWQNELGVPWPAKDEFEVGCTYEHAGYLLTWLAFFFGPATTVTSFASCLLPDKGISIETMAPDFTVGCIEYEDSVVARVTCSLIAPKDKSLTVVGDDGVLTVADVRNDRCAVYVRNSEVKRWRGAIERRLNSLRRTLQFPGYDREWLFWERYPLVNAPAMKLVSKGKPVDFCRGPAELAAAIHERRACRLSGQLGVHVTELVESLQYPMSFGNRRQLTTKFDRIEPLWQ